LRLQCLQQPELQSVMIGVVMRLADQDPWHWSQLLDQLLRTQALPRTQVDYLPQIGVLTPLGALPVRQRRQGGLATSKQSDNEHKQQAHRESLVF
jgi:hypothetical protein